MGPRAAEVDGCILACLELLLFSQVSFVRSFALFPHIWLAAASCLLVVLFECILNGTCPIQILTQFEGVRVPLGIQNNRYLVE